jgi:AraC-like DNA-binding protein
LPGEFVFVSPGVDHRVDAFPDDTADTLLLCGYSVFDAPKGNLLLRDMAPFIVINQDQLQKMPWVKRTLEHLSSEYLSDAISTELTVNKLTEILIIQLIQSEFGEKKRAGVIAALRDKRLAKALDRIHENLQDQWTIAKAAHHASMSRSGFARVFTQLIGLSFYEYLTQIRIQRASNLLLESSQSVADIAMMVGYQSELSFVKVFKKRAGMTPRAFRLGVNDN